MLELTFDQLLSTVSATTTWKESTKLQLDLKEKEENPEHTAEYKSEKEGESNKDIATRLKGKKTELGTSLTAFKMYIGILMNNLDSQMTDPKTVFAQIKTLLATINPTQK